MSNNDDNDGEKPDNVIDFSKFKKPNGDGRAHSASSSGEQMPLPPAAESGRRAFPHTGEQKIPTVGLPQRKFRIYIEGGAVEVDGLLALTSNFLAVGDMDGTFKFVAANGHWAFVEDVTDNEGVLFPLSTINEDEELN